jgi:hypothetical protein
LREYLFSSHRREKERRYRVTRRTNPATIRSTDLISLPMLCAGLR